MMRQLHNIKPWQIHSSLKWHSHFLRNRGQAQQICPHVKRTKDKWGSAVLLAVPLVYGLSSLSQKNDLPWQIAARSSIADPGKLDTSKSTWFRLFSLRKTVQNPEALPVADQPVAIGDCLEIVARNCPVFYFHHDERYYPCTVEFFLERCQLLLVAKGWKRRVLKVLIDYGMLDANTLAEEQARFEECCRVKKGQRQFLQLKLSSDARHGQTGNVNEVPIYATVKETLDPLLGRRDGIEVNYMKFLAYNGPYKLFHSIWVGPLGAHDADWEHVTVRLTPDGKKVVGVYYSAHRHRDGLWRSADEVPRAESGRPLAYIAENGHGSYPVAGTIWRLFCVINDYTSDKGLKWDPQKVVLVTQAKDDRLPSVVSRGSSLNGSSYAPSTSATHPKVERENAAWLKFEGKWGSTVEAPQKQEWFLRAENPVSRSSLQQIFFPLLPGVQSIWEPAVEEVEEALEKFRDGMDEGMDVFKQQAEGVQQEFKASRKQAYKRWRQIVREIQKKSKDDE